MRDTFCTANLRPVADTLELLSGKWKLLILSLLHGEGPLRFGEMGRAIGSITPRMLSKELKDLEQNKLVERRVYSTMPVTVDYRLSDYGQSLEPVMIALGEWGKTHRRRIMQPPIEAVAS
ncbi:winged helix-turn-helix transcriptional regulator [Spirosoma arcticum]